MRSGGGPGVCFTVYKAEACCFCDRRNDKCEFPRDLGIGDSISDSTNDADAPGQGPLCGVQAQTQPGRWFRLLGHAQPNPIEVTVNVIMTGVSGFHRANIYCGDCKNLTCVVDGSDGAQITFCASPNTDYLIVVFPETAADVPGPFDLHTSTAKVGCVDTISCP